MRHATLALLPLLALAACATPRESCINDATRDLRQVNALIQTTQANLARGYGIETRQETRVVPGLCDGESVDSQGNVTHFTYQCERTVVNEIEVPVVIDIAAERRHLDQLVEQQRRLERQSQAQIQACIAAYPE
ncbi:MAG: hypothetical protein IT542_13865 [Rubellimicrobium sp.]|nr:hypothetical protein [Rubellimicrobium sp.]